MLRSCCSAQGEITSEGFSPLTFTEGPTKVSHHILALKHFHERPRTSNDAFDGAPRIYTTPPKAWAKCDKMAAVMSLSSSSDSVPSPTDIRPLVKRIPSNEDFKELASGLTPGMKEELLDLHRRYSERETDYVEPFFLRDGTRQGGMHSGKLVDSPECITRFSKVP